MRLQAGWGLGSLLEGSTRALCRADSSNLHGLHHSLLPSLFQMALWELWQFEACQGHCPVGSHLCPFLRGSQRYALRGETHQPRQVDLPCVTRAGGGRGGGLASLIFLEKQNSNMWGLGFHRAGFVLRVCTEGLYCGFVQGLIPAGEVHGRGLSAAPEGSSFLIQSVLSLEQLGGVNGMN